MTKAKQAFFWTSNLKGHGFYGDEATILYLILKCYSLAALSEKLYFLEIGPVNRKLFSRLRTHFNMCATEGSFGGLLR